MPGSSGESQPHRFIIYQYGKVGSTSLTDTLNRRKGIEAHQVHFLGETAFTEVFERLMNPAFPDYFFEHSAGQLIANMRVFRYFLRRDIDPSPLTIITLAREPFEWFRSAISQDAAEHLDALKRMLDVRGMAYASDDEALATGLPFLFERLAQAVAHFGDLDAMCAGQRYPELRENMEHVDQEDFRSFMFFVNIFLRPHLWFHTQFSDALGIGLEDFERMDCGAFRNAQSWGNTYLLRYEDLGQAFGGVMADLGYDGDIKLARKNLGRRKPLSQDITAAFGGEQAQVLRALCHSRDTRFLGYETVDNTGT